MKKIGKGKRDKNGIRVRTVNNSFLCFSCLALFLLLEFWQEYKKTKKRRKEWGKKREKCWMWISDACATFPIYTRSPGIKLERRRRRRQRRSWCGGSGGRGLSALPLHLHITWQLQLCCFVLAGWLARWVQPAAASAEKSPGTFDSANPPRRKRKKEKKME